MKLFGYVSVFLVVSSLACGKQDMSELPEDEVLISMLVDLHLAESALARVPFSVRDSVGQVLRDKVAAGYDMTGEEFEQVVQMLQLETEHNSEIYDSVIARLRKVAPENIGR